MDYYRKFEPEHGDNNIDDFVYSMDNLFNEKKKWKIKPGDWGGDPTFSGLSTEGRKRIKKNLLDKTKSKD